MIAQSPGVHDATDVVRPRATDPGLGIKYFNLPGGDRDFQGHRYDGYVGEIKFTYDGRSCPRGLS